MLKAVLGAVLFSLAAPVALAEPAKFEVALSAVHEVTSAKLGRNFQIFVKRPSGYLDPQNADRRYPAIYLSDGPYTFPVAAGATGAPMHEKVLERAFIIAFSSGAGEDHQELRVLDLTPFNNPGWKRDTGGAEEYLGFLTDEALPFLENRYRIDPARRIYVGQSLGGLFGAWVLLTRPETFEAYILTSPSLWFHDRRIFAVEKETAADRKDIKARVYFATGGQETSPQVAQDMVADQSAFAAALRARKYSGLEIRDEIIPDGLHLTTFPQGFTRGVQWLFQTGKE